MNIGIFGLSGQISDATVLRQRYHRLTKVFHPDKVAAELRPVSLEVTDQLHQLYKTFSSPLAVYVYSRYGTGGLALLQRSRKEFEGWELSCLGASDPTAFLARHAEEIDRLFASIYYAGTVVQRWPFFAQLEYTLDFRQRGLHRPINYTLSLPLLAWGKYALGLSGTFKGTLSALRTKVSANCAFFYPLGRRTVSGNLVYCFSSRRWRLEQGLELGRKWSLSAALPFPAPEKAMAVLKRSLGPSKTDVFVLSANRETLNAKLARKFKPRENWSAVPELNLYGSAQLIVGRVELRCKLVKDFRLFTQLGAHIRNDLEYSPQFTIGWRTTSRACIFSLGMTLSPSSPAFLFSVSVADLHLRVPVPILSPEHLVFGCALLLVTGMASHFLKCGERTRARRLAFQAHCAELNFVTEAVEKAVFIMGEEEKSATVVQALLVSEEDCWRQRLQGKEELPAVDVTKVVHFLYMQKGHVSHADVLELLSTLRGKSLTETFGPHLKIYIIYHLRGTERSLQLFPQRSTDFGGLSAFFNRI